MRRLLTAVISGVIVLALMAGWIVWSNRSFEETFYTMESYKIEEPIRVILLTDLHEKTFGEGNQALYERVEALEPDAILLGGDIVNKKNTDWNYAVELCRNLAAAAPVYYGLGNHENEALYGEDLNLEFLDGQAAALGDPPEDFTPLLQNPQAWADLEAAGARLVQNESAVVDIKGNAVEIGGVGTNRSSFWPYSGQFITRFSEENPEYFKLLISHRPETVTEYLSQAPIDLVVSGHNHGGVVRIPGVGGVFSAEGTLFPAYDGGWYELDGPVLLVSRGLGGHGFIPRVFNRPELVVVDIN